MAVSRLWLGNMIVAVDETGDASSLSFGFFRHGSGREILNAARRQRDFRCSGLMTGLFIVRDDHLLCVCSHVRFVLML
jgi:hypothetical protein